MGLLWFDFEYITFTWESLWPNFRKYSFSPIDFNDFMHPWDYLGVTLDVSRSNLESLWGTLGSLGSHLGVTLGSLGVTLGHLGATLGHFGTALGHFGLT